jgi:hypothetical protein
LQISQDNKILELFLNSKTCRLSPRVMDHVGAQSTVDQFGSMDKWPPGHGGVLTRAASSSRSGAWKLTSQGWERRGEVSEPVLRLTQAQETVRRPGYGGKVVAVVELLGGNARAQRGEEGGVGCGGGRVRTSPFYRGQRAWRR